MRRFGLVTYIARKYFLSRKNANFINVLSFVSVGALAVGAAALFVILSVFNGMSGLIRGVHHSFDSEIIITPNEGKSFVTSDSLLQSIQQVEGVRVVTEVIEDEAFVNFKDVQKVVRVKGVGSNFSKQNTLYQYFIDTIPDFIEGDNIHIETDSTSYAVIGIGIQQELGINIHHGYYPIEIYYPKRNKKVLRNSAESFNRINISAGGVFALERQYDERYIIIPLDYAELLFDFPNERTGIEVSTHGNIESTIQNLQTALGPDYKVLNSDERHKALYKAIKVEKLAVFLILSFVLCIAAVNIFLTITMIVISKKKDIAVMKSFGASNLMVKRIFLMEGALIGLFGTSIGLGIGYLICFLQETYGFVVLNAQATLVTAFPVKMQLSDLLASGLITLSITILISLYPAHKAGQISTRTEL